MSSNALVRVRVPERLQGPQRQADDSITVTAGDADGAGLLAVDSINIAAQVSTNLVDWVPLSEPLILTNGILLLVDPSSTNSAARFYRTVEK
jgi:hypothetical protein